MHCLILQSAFEFVLITVRLDCDYSMNDSRARHFLYYCPRSMNYVKNGVTYILFQEMT